MPVERALRIGVGGPVGSGKSSLIAALCGAHFAHVELYGLFHARKLALHQVAIERLGWDAIHRRLGITERFYDRFVPAISARDFALRAGRGIDRALDLVAVLRP